MFSLFYHSKTCLRLHTNVVVYSSSSRFFHLLFFQLHLISRIFFLHEISFFFVLYQQLCPRSGYAHLIHSKYNNSNIVAGIIQTLLFKKQRKRKSFPHFEFFPKVCMVFFFHFSISEKFKKTKKMVVKDRQV